MKTLAIVFVTVLSVNAQANLDSAQMKKESDRLISKVNDLLLCKNESQCEQPSLNAVEQSLRLLEVHNGLSKAMFDSKIEISNSGEELQKELKQLQDKAQTADSKNIYANLIQKAKNNSNGVDYIINSYDNNLFNREGKFYNDLLGIKNILPKLSKERVAINQAMKKISNDSELEILSTRTERYKASVSNIMLTVEKNSHSLRNGVTEFLRLKEIPMSGEDLVSINDFATNIDDRCAGSLDVDIPLNTVKGRNLLKFLVEGNGKGPMKVKCSKKNNVAPAFDIKKHTLNVHYSKSSDFSASCNSGSDVFVIPFPLCPHRDKYTSQSGSNAVLDVLLVEANRQ